MSQIIKIAILAVGGQGGGVLSNWITSVALENGYQAQMTSVAGVAQRTGATVYYIEMAKASDRQPVFALSPKAGDVDVLIAAEIMEAGRAAMRGFVTPDRTTLIASTHRILAVSEKQIMGDGRGDADAVLAQLKDYAARLLAFDMEAIAKDAGSMISASLFGALAKSGALPFEGAQFRAIIENSGKGAEASLRAFDAALDYAPQDVTQKADAPKQTVTGPPDLLAQWNGLLTRSAEFPTDAQPMIKAGLRSVVAYQDIAYGTEYLDRLSPFMGHSDDLDKTAAKYIANAMCYNDLPRVADLKTRAARNARLRKEQEIPHDGLVQVTEYFHPRAEEICATLPRALGAWASRTSWVQSLLNMLFSKGRRLRTDSILGFGSLYCVAGLRRFRRSLMRHQTELAHLDRLTTKAASYLPDNPELAVEVLSCQRLIKGYSDTHARGLSRFDLVMDGFALIEDRPDGADWLRRLREAALQDVEGQALDGALETIRSFTDPSRFAA